MRSLTFLACLLTLAACQRKSATPRAQSAPEAPTHSTTAKEDAQALGQEIYDLMDQAMSYSSAHHGRSAGSLRELGLDDLTPATSRTLTLRNGTPEVTVSYRNPTGHALSSCRGNPMILEDATIRGSYTLACDSTGGGSTSFTVQR